MDNYQFGKIPVYFNLLNHAAVHKSISLLINRLTGVVKLYPLSLSGADFANSHGVGNKHGCSPT